MKLTIQIPTYIEVDKFKKDHKAFLKYLSKHCTYSIEQSSNGYGYTSFVCGPVREKSLHAFIDNYFKLFLEEIDEMKDTDFERLCESKPGLQYDFKFFTPVSLEAIADIKVSCKKPTFHFIKDGICQNCLNADPLDAEQFKSCPAKISTTSERLSKEHLAEMTATLTRQYNGIKALDIWLSFKELHPNTPENPDYSEASVKRWLYHINEAEKNKGFEKVELDMTEIGAIRKRKAISRWDDFDAYQKRMYLSIGKCYPGSQVFACGSQVRGDHMTMDSHIISARKKAGMRTDRESDFDYWIHPNIPTAALIPAESDRYRGKFNEKEMVAIPIYYGDV